MGNQEDYKRKLEAISSIEESQIKAPHNIPVDVYIQEADTLYHWVKEDKEALTGCRLVLGVSGGTSPSLPGVNRS